MILETQLVHAFEMGGILFVEEITITTIVVGDIAFTMVCEDRYTVVLL